MTRIGRIAVVAALSALLVVVAGCGAKEKQPARAAKVSPPAVKTAGTLSVGVDMSQPPFAGEDAGKKAGIDIDVAAAVAQKLGLIVEYVDVKPSDAATALAEGTVDMVMSVPLTDASLSTMSLAGSYIADGPAFFIATESTAPVTPYLTLDNVTAGDIAVQKKSLAYWKITGERGEQAVKVYPSLRDAISALDEGKTKVAAGDAIVGAYIARDFPNVHFVGQLSPADPLAVAVAADNATLSDSVRATLDGLVADGVIATIRRKWVGDLPELTLAESSAEDATPAP